MLKTMLSLRTARALMLIAALALALNLGGCSWFAKKKPVDLGGGPTADGLVVPQLPGGEVPPSAAGEEPRRPLILEAPEDFPATAGVADVRFDYDKADVRADQQAILEKNLEYFKAHPAEKIMIEGHCDERGSTEYNLALGQRRAAAVQDFLLRGGIAADRLATISRGKEMPLDPGNNEAAWAKNRRGHFLKFK